MDGHTRVAEFIATTTWRDIPEDTRRTARLALLDAVGAAVSGTLADIRKISLAFATRAMRGDEARVLVFGNRLTAAGAAFVNANAANAFDRDMETLHPDGRFATAVTAVLKDGRELSAEHSRRSFGHKLTWEQLVDKFHGLTRFVLPREKRDRIVEAIRAVDQTDDLRELIESTYRTDP